MLFAALDSLLEEKGFEEISIQDIASRAVLNRATFYLHYSDKEALLQALTKHRFRALLERRGIVFDGCDGALRAIALGTCDYLVDRAHNVDNPGTPSVEISITRVIAAIFRDGIERHEPPAKTNAALLAATVAWAIFGAAREWLVQPNRVPAEEMARRIEILVTPLFTVDGVLGAGDWTGVATKPTNARSTKKHARSSRPKS
jgi:AcrR family transcriptional regulator